MLCKLMNSNKLCCLLLPFWKDNMFFNREGEKWHKLRTVLNKRMLHPKDSVQYGDVVNAVVTDFIKRIYYLREMSPTGDRVSNLTKELYRFSLEGISFQALEIR